MKQLTLLFSLLLLATAFSFGQTETEQRIDADIETIVVYLDGAEINRSQNVRLQQGRNRIVFEGLSPKMDVQNIRVTTDEEVSILAISTKTNFLNKIDEKPRILQLRDSLKLVEDKMKEVNDYKAAYQAERDMVMKNQSIGSTQSGVAVDELQRAADFFRNRLTEINRQISKYNTQLSELARTQTRLRSELSELNDNLNYVRNEISILLASEKVQTVPVTISYLVRQAGWVPAYELRTSDVNQPVELIYRAKVFNNTDIDWKNARLTLSTGDPTVSASKPDINPWYLNFSTGISNANFGYDNNALQWTVTSEDNEGRVQSRSTYDMPSGTDETVVNQPETGETAVYREVEVSSLSAEFEIETPYSIPADDKPYLVDMAEYELPANYKHYAIPKLNKDVFLLARITGWEDLNLVEGEASVYFAGTYVGKSYIHTRDTRDTLDLSLGRDPKVLVTRTKLNEYSSTKFIGSNRKETFAYEMVIKNNRQTPITIEVIDQLPVSQNSDIEVEAIEISDAHHIETTGELRWLYNLPAKESKHIRLTFSIKYPKNTEIQLKQSRRRMMRSF